MNDNEDELKIDFQKLDQEIFNLYKKKTKNVNLEIEKLLKGVIDNVVEG
jgi:hypothetical protein